MLNWIELKCCIVWYEEGFFLFSFQRKQILKWRLRCIVFDADTEKIKENGYKLNFQKAFIEHMQIRLNILQEGLTFYGLTKHSW